MNPKGHSKTLVPAHPENRNAVTSGVYSHAIVAERVAEIEKSFAEHPAEVIAYQVLRYEVAALSALGALMDRSLEQDGLFGRRGEPRTLLSHRIRLNERLRRTTENLVQTQQMLSAHAPPEAGGEAALPLAARIAQVHNVDAITELAPADVNPQLYLQAFIESTDVGDEDRARARKTLSKREAKIARCCVCFPGPPARDPAEFRAWVRRARDHGHGPDEDDAKIAALTRLFAGGGDPPRPWQNYMRTRRAVEAALDAAGGPHSPIDTRERDPGVAPFWRSLLAPHEATTPKKRLQAFVALEEAGALRTCTCGAERDHRLWEDDLDELRAYVIHALTRRDRLAADARVLFPETDWALREAIDERLLSAPDAPPEEDDAEAA